MIDEEIETEIFEDGAGSRITASSPSASIKFVTFYDEDGDEVVFLADDLQEIINALKECELVYRNLKEKA